MKTDHQWQQSAACAQVDPELWFPTGPEDALEARRICHTSCPVREACLEAAMAEEHPDNPRRFRREGIRGGLTPPERKRLQERRTSDHLRQTLAA